ncbi:MAG: DUF3108 domain-containing protein [Burkholderiales bacterium]|nr:DUF3108 domain-containing protein [Burkholderiales bacterium]
MPPNDIDVLSAPAPRPMRYRRAPTWLLWVVLAAHAMGIEWLARHTTGLALLQTMVEPEFNQSLTLQASAPQREPSVTPSTELPASSTVGQVVQARTVVPAWPVLEQHSAPSDAVPRLHKVTPQPKTAQPTDMASATQPADNHVTAEPQDTPRDAPVDRSDSPSPNTAAPLPQLAEQEAAPPVVQPPIAAAQPLKPGTLANTTDDPASWLASWPRSTRLNYQLKGYYRGDFFGHARVQWQRSAQRYQAQIHVNVGLLLDMRMTSQGRITATRLWPEAYEEDRRSKKRSARFGDQMVTLDNGNTLNRPPHLQDTASQFVQLAQDFAMKRQPLQVGAVVPVTLGRPGGIDDWLYDVVSMETVPTPLGELAAYHLKPRPLPNARGTVSAEIWFAPALQHLPVRIRLSLNPETWLDLTLDNVAQSD